MQDRYAGDVGDFGKYGLLRALCRADAHGPAFRLGVVWYLVQDETHNADGKHVGYLHPTKESLYRHCDPALYDCMQGVAAGRRGIRAIEGSQALPADTAYFSEPLALNDASTAARHAHRQEWLTTAAEAMSSADVIFLDPDNGLEVVSVPSSSSKAAKYRFMDDLDTLVKPHQSAVIYHHLGRRDHSAEISLRLSHLNDRWRDRMLFGLRFRRGTSRAFLVAATAGHQQVLRARADDLIQGAWGTNAHFEQRIFPT